LASPKVKFFFISESSDYLNSVECFRIEVGE
jgi:hypothetical protein